MHISDRGPFWKTHQFILGGGCGTVLSFTGSTTIAQGASSPDNVLTLVVLNNPSTDPYDSFEEVTDADNIASLSGDEITIDTTSVIASSIVYKAVSSGGRPDLTITISINVTDTTAPSLSSVSPADNATDVAIDADIVITWGENVVAGAGVLSLKLTSDDSTIDSWDIEADAGAGAGQFEISGGAVTFHLTTDLDNSVEYYLVWPAGLVEDAAGNGVAAQASTTAYSFTTVASDPYAAIDAIASTTGSYWDVANAGSRWQDTGKTVPAGNGDPCRVLEDLSGNGHDFVAPSDGTRPVVTVSGSVAYLTFTSASLHKMSTPSYQQTKTTEGEWFVGAAVYITDALSAVQSILIADNSTAARIAQYIRYNSATLESIAFTGGGTPAIDGGGTVVIDTFYRLTAEAAYNAGSETVEVFKDNASSGSTSIASLIAGTSQELWLFVNRDTDGTYSGYAGGRFYRGCHFPLALSVEQKTTVDTYLNGNGP